MFEQGKKVAIIGGGIAGMAMALALHKLSIPCEVYEMRESLKLAKRWLGGGMMLQPNSLRIMDQMGVYERLAPKGYKFDWVYYMNANEEFVDRYPLGDAANYGYDAIRIFRQELLNDMFDTCVERGIPIHFGKKFTRVVDESDDGVTFEFADGTTARAEMMVGADGIHSKIRDYVCPGAKSTYLRLVAITYVTQTSKIRIPKDKDYHFPMGLTTTNGIFMLAPQKADGSEMLAGTQFFMEERSKEEWDDLLNRPDELKAMLRNRQEVWPDIIQSALEEINEDTFNIWPFYLLPRLARWTSEKSRRVVLIGDAAHGLPPTTGQGASQAFEDVHSLSLLVAALQKHPELRWQDALDYWQKMRQDRIQDLMELTRLLNNKRLPSDKLALMKREDVWWDESKTNPKQMAWLYLPDIDGKIASWVEEKLKEVEAAQQATQPATNGNAPETATPEVVTATPEVVSTPPPAPAPALASKVTPTVAVAAVATTPPATPPATVPTSNGTSVPASPLAASLDSYVAAFEAMSPSELSATRAKLHIMMAALEIAQNKKDAAAMPTVPATAPATAAETAAAVPPAPPFAAFNFADFKNPEVKEVK